MAFSPSLSCKRSPMRAAGADKAARERASEQTNERAKPKEEEEEEDRRRRRRRDDDEEKQWSQPASPVRHLWFFCFFSPVSSSFSSPACHFVSLPCRLHFALLVSTHAPLFVLSEHKVTHRLGVVSHVHFSRLTRSHQVTRE